MHVSIGVSAIVLSASPGPVPQAQCLVSSMHPLSPRLLRILSLAHLRVVGRVTEIPVVPMCQGGQDKTSLKGSKATV